MDPAFGTQTAILRRGRLFQKCCTTFRESGSQPEKSLPRPVSEHGLVSGGVFT